MSGSFVPWFPEAGNYIRKFNVVTKDYEYLRLLWQREAFKYQYRFSSLAADTKHAGHDFEDLNPSKAKDHIYLVYLGLKPGFYYLLYHPFDVLQQKWDETPDDIDDDLSKSLTHDQSPYDYPVKTFAIERDRYPNITPFNMSGITNTPEVIFYAARYIVQPHEKIPADIIDKLNSGHMRSYPWDFGGEQ